MMAPRKDLMQIIRRDSGFSEKLGFGSGPLVVHEGAAGGRQSSGGIAAAPKETRDEKETLAAPLAPSSVKSGTRGCVVYVAVSLTERQATLAQAWAEAALCPVSLLIRHVAQGMRDQMCADWAVSGIPQVNEPRGARGKYPTSVTLTLPADFAAALKAKRDPLGLMGLGRAIGPAFRQRFEAAFDAALTKAKFMTKDNEGDAQ
ncbi:hypothetical protein [Stagnihabitans tardus]|uniref:Uncharacterized protein n=1 Tax=Stagnihabitans tardus TaxID=2699202 RepID=A0AAE5BTM3_9RHOB|nr:hypothetical protein [Stagnihabitans tardus]NBZ89195.1 hypothetical protein [Stagnihabitans tardus]